MQPATVLVTETEKELLKASGTVPSSAGISLCCSEPPTAHTGAGKMVPVKGQKCSPPGDVHTVLSDVSVVNLGYGLEKRVCVVLPLPCYIDLPPDTDQKN